MSDGKTGFERTEQTLESERNRSLSEWWEYVTDEDKEVYTYHNIDSPPKPKITIPRKDDTDIIYNFVKEY